MFYRQMVFLVAEGILLFIFILSVLSGTGFLAFAVLFLSVVLVYWYVKGNNRVFEDFGNHTVCRVGGHRLVIFCDRPHWQG